MPVYYRQGMIITGSASMFDWLVPSSFLHTMLLLYEPTNEKKDTFITKKHAYSTRIEKFTSKN